MVMQLGSVPCNKLLTLSAPGQLCGLGTYLLRHSEQRVCGNGILRSETGIDVWERSGEGQCEARQNHASRLLKVCDWLNTHKSLCTSGELQDDTHVGSPEISQ